MDYFESEVTESLDFLSPPVKRVYRNTERERVYQPNNAFNQHNPLLRDFRTTVAKQTRTQLPVERPDGPSSTSLVLKRTTEREILERYSVLSYTNLQYSNNIIKPQTINTPDKERPLIKVTVIPNNSEESQTAKLSRKRRHKTNKVQSTVSNQENSIKAKNVYLVVAGRKREKIYEIKTTGSAEFRNNLNFKDGDAAIEQVTQFKQLISSLNMDKKKKKAKKKDVAPKDSGMSLVKQMLEGPDPVFRDCSCFNDVPSGSPKDVQLHKSRVRICGKIGVTEDDRYILKCAATVNDKPAESSNMQRSFVQCRNGRQSIECQQDSNIQADFRNKNSKKTQEIHHNMRSKETQCTQCPQDNFNTVCFSNIETLQISSKKDQLVQCHCLQPSEDVVRYEYESETTKGIASPLVIISVYPKQDFSERVNDISPVRNKTTRPSSKKTNVYNMNANQRVNNVELPKPDNNTNKRETRPGTHSPSLPRSPMRSWCDNSQEKGTSRLDNNQEKVRSRLNDNQETATRMKMIYEETSPGTRFPSPPRSPTRSRFDNNQEKGRSSLDNNQEKVKSRLNDNQETATRMKMIYEETSPGTRFPSPPRSPTRSRFDNNQEKGRSSLDNHQEKVKSRLNDNQEIASRKTMIYKETSPGTRSPSPPRSPTRSRCDNNQEKGRSRLDNNHEKVKSRLNDNQETATRKKIIYKETSPTNNNNTNKPEQGKPKPRQNVPQARPDNKRQTNQKYYSGQQVAAGSNTDHNLQKKTIVDSYTQKLAAQMKKKKAMNWTAPKNDVSNVTINIDAENEFYDVLFHQSDLTTDLRVRKTVKNQGSQKGYGEEDHSASLENFFLINQEEPRTSFSQMYLDEPSYQPDNVAMLDPVSRLKVRDSIEISHRREDRISICATSGKMPLSYKVYSSETNNEENRKFFAPIKHYRGDSCALPDPVQRDKEIRELLGIKTGRPNTTKAIEEESMSAIEDHSLHCFYQTTCDNTDFGSNIQDSMCSIYKLNPPCCCTIPRESDQSDSIKSGQSGTSQQNIKHQKHLPAAKKQTVSKVKDSNLPESDESKQIEQKLSKTSKKHKTKSIPKYSDQSDSDDSKDKPEDSGESDSDESKQKPNDSDKTDSDESKQKPIDSDQSDSEKQKTSNIKSLLGSLKKRKSSKPKDSDQTDTDEPQNFFQKTSNSLKKRFLETIKPKDSDQVDSDDSNKKATESDQSDSNDSKQQLKESDESDSDKSEQKPLDSDQSDSDEPQKIDYKTSNYMKKGKITTPTDSSQTYSEELKQTTKDTDESDTDESSKKFRGIKISIRKSSKRKNSDQPVKSCCCGDHHRKIDRTPPHSLKRGKYPKPKHSDQSDSDDQRKIDRKSHPPLKKGKTSELKDSDQPDSDDQQQIDRKSHHPLKKGKSAKPKRSDQSDSDDQRKIDRSSSQSLKKRQISVKHEKSEARDLAESKVIYDKYGSSAKKTQSNKNYFYETDSDKHLKSKSRHKNLYKPYAVDQAPLYQQLILNRNINVYLQIEQFTKQKPIVLSRKQYDKVKKTIENASTKKTKMCICTKSSSISLGEVRKKPETVPTHYHKSIQSEADAKLNIKEDSKEKAKEKEIEKERAKEKEMEKAREIEMEKARETEIEKEKAKEQEKEMEKAREKEMEKEKVKEIEKTKEKANRKEKESAKEKSKGKSKKGRITTKCCKYCGKTQPAVPLCCEYCGKIKNKGCYNCGRPLYYGGDACPSYNDCYCGVDQGKTVVLYEGKFKKLDEPVNINENAKSSGRTASSVEIRYTSVAYMKHVTFSSTKVDEETAIPSTSNIAKKKSYHSDSLYTIFKGHRKTPTPNLGTSACSLYSEYSDARSPEPQDLKARKPFLKRLMSCLVMRSKASEMKIGRPVPKMTSMNSSVDSYHFSTSLGAIELTSSMYDTSASFYSNHTILPMNSKMKRGFFSSVRGFLTTNRKS